MPAGATTATAWQIEFDRAAQIKAGVVAAAFVALFHSILYEQAFKWWDQAADWGHGWLIPAFSAYMVHLNWDRIRRCPVRYTGVGLAILLAGLAAYQYALWRVPFGYVRPLTMMVVLLGMIVYLCGLPALRYLWVPWAYLFFAIPLPQSIYFRLTEPLAELSGWVAVTVLSAWNPEISLDGQVVRFMHNGRVGELQVAAACAGMRATITLCALGVAIAFITERAWWQRAIMIASCAPIAVLSNFIRVLITVYLYIYVHPKYAEGTWHTLLGLFTLLVLGLGAFMLLGWVLEHLFVADEDERKPRAATTSTERRATPT